MTPIRQFVVYGLGGAASRLAAIVLVPLYTRTLPVDAYGRLELALALHTLVVLLAGMQVESAVARDYHEALTAGRMSGLARSALMLTLAGSACALVVAAMLAVAGPAAGWFSTPELLLLGALTLPAQLLGVQLVMLRFAGRAVAYALLSFADLAIAALLSSVFIVALGWGVPGALAGILVAKTACALLAWRPTMAGALVRVPAGEDGAAWRRRLLAYGIPALPAVLVSWLQSTGNRVVVGSVLTLQDVAFAGVALKVGAIFGFVVYSLRLAWEPHSIARLEHHADDPSYFRRALERYVLLMFPVLAVALLGAPWAVRLLAPPAYAAAATAAVFMIAAQYWVGVTNMVIIGIQGARQMARLLPVYGWGAGVNVAALLLTARALGAVAAGVALFLGTVVSALLAASISNRVFGTMFPSRLLACALAMTGGLAAAFAMLLDARGTPAAHAGTLAHWLGGGAALALLAGALLAQMGLGRARSLAILGEVRALVLARRHA